MRAWPRVAQSILDDSDCFLVWFITSMFVIGRAHENIYDKIIHLSHYNVVWDTSSPTAVSLSPDAQTLFMDQLHPVKVRMQASVNKQTTC